VDEAMNGLSGLDGSDVIEELAKAELLFYFIRHVAFEVEPRRGYYQSSWGYG
jgi:hypothetical protein